MSTDLSLRIVVGATDQASSVVSYVADNIVGSISKVNPALGAVAGGMFAIVGGSVAVGVASTRMAADFQTAMLSNVAHAGLAKDQFDSVSQSVLNMASVVGRSPTQLAEALYPILSAFSGIQNQSAKSAIALDTLKMSFQTVAGTTVDGTAVANAAVGTFNALGLATNNVGVNTQRMTGLFDVMDKTVQLGNMQWDAYKNVVSKLAVAIQGTGISFNESQAALATMTNEGFSAQRASTYLSNTFTTLAIKTDALAKHAKALGINFDESKYGPMSLADKIAYLNKITDGNKQKLLALMGNNSTALKTFNALSVGVGAYKSNLNSLNHAQGALKSSFDTASQGFNFQMSQMKAAGDALMITIGQALLPLVSQIAKQIIPVITQFTAWLAHSNLLSNAIKALGSYLNQYIIPPIKQALAVIIPLIQQIIQGAIHSGGLQQAFMMVASALPPILNGFSQFVQVLAHIIGFILNNQAAFTAFKIILIVIGAVIVGVLVAAFLLMAITLASVTIAILLFVAPIIGIIWAIQHWGDIVKWLGGVWHATIAFIQAVVAAGIAWLKHAWENAVNTVVGWFSWLYNHNYYFQHLVDFIAERITWIRNFLTMIWSAIVVFIQQKWEALVNLTQTLWRNISGIFSGAWNTYIAGPLGGLWNQFTGWFGNLIGLAESWGGNLIKSFASGITGAIGNVTGAVQGVIGKVGAFLGFHSPSKEGEGQHLLEWPRNMIHSYADEMVKQKPYLENALHMVVAPLAIMNHATPLTNSTPLVHGSSGGNTINLALTVHAPGRDDDEAEEIADLATKKIAQLLLSEGVLNGGLYH